MLSPTEPSTCSPPSPDYRTRDQSEEKQHFHLLPRLQAKRGDFLSVILTGTLPHRRGCFATLEEPEEPEGQQEGEAEGPRDDDVTKSESEGSQEGAPSTLMAEGVPRGTGGLGGDAGDPGDPDLEDASRTLVLFSPGDTRKSPCGGASDGELAVPTTLFSRTERLQVAEAGEAAVPAVQGETGRMSPVLRSDLRPSAPASPPFTKVERTFVHIAETSHLNVMSSNGVDRRPAEEQEQEEEVKEEVEVEVDKEEGGQQEVSEGAMVLERVMVESLEAPVPEPEPKPEPGIITVQNPEFTLESVGSSPGGTEPPAAELRNSRIRSRIPVLVLEEEEEGEPGSERSARAALRQRARGQDLGRLLVQRQQDRWRKNRRNRILSGTSSLSLSSGEEERRRTSETPSTTCSEEDTQHTQSSESRRSGHLKAMDKEASKGSRSRIPRPVLALKKPPSEPAEARTAAEPSKEASAARSHAHGSVNSHCQ